MTSDAMRTGAVGSDDWSLADPPEGLWGPVRVLLAEDDDELRWALAEVFRHSGYDVTAVSNGAKLVDALAGCLLPGGRPPDVVITDMRMPGFNGLRVLEGFRAAGWPTPFIVITAFGDEETRRRAKRAGATAFLDKPIDPLELEEAVRSAVAERSM